MVAELKGLAKGEPKKYTFSHEKLGTITGWQRGDDVVQFRGIPYADIPGRFRQSVMRSKLPTQPFDATNPRATCPHPKLDYWKYWEADLPSDLPKLQPTYTDEFDCLNLSITLPLHALLSKKSLPVFVFIHGGAFVGGSHAIQLHGREVFDPTGLVRHSIKIGKDIIGVGINYRVGPLGFLASKELSAFNSSHNEIVGNYGLHDQRQALEWLYQFVASFGGDPERITIQGTSAGAASCHFLSLFPERRFQRAILASGTCWGIGAVTEDVAQQTFDRVVRATGDEEGGFDRIMNLDVDTLNSCVQFTVFNPLVDNVWVEKNALLPPDAQETTPVEIMVGAALREDDIAELFLRDPATWKFRSDEDAWQFMSRTFSRNGCVASPENFPFDNQALMHAYGLEKLHKDGDSVPSLELETHWQSWAALLGHVLFNFPTYLLAEKLAKSSIAPRTWLYHYEARNPYPASHSRDMAHHGVNDLFLFNVAPDQIPEEHVDSWNGASEQTQLSWIEFINGEEPWSPLDRNSDETGPVFVFAGGEESREYKAISGALGDHLAEKWFAMRRSCFN